MARTLDAGEIQEILDRVASGAPILSTLRELGATWRDWLATLRADDRLGARWADAREIAGFLIPDAMLEIAKTTKDGRKAKNILDTYKFIAQSHNKTVYGNTVKIEKTLNISVSNALAAGRDRVRELAPSDVRILANDHGRDAILSSISELTSDGISDAISNAALPVPSLFDDEDE